MKHIYSKLGKPARILSLVGLLALSTASFAQNSTSVSRSPNCGNVAETFNDSSAFYTSPSLYSDQKNDSAFYYKKSMGFWTERGEDGVVRGMPAVPREVSILSRTYPSPPLAGVFDVGFVYVVPNPNVDQFYVALVRLVRDPATNITSSETVARSGYKLFNEFEYEAPEPYSDTAGHVGQRGAVCIRLIDQDIVIGPNVEYRVEVTYKIITGGTWTIFDDFSLNNIEPGGTLPVTFMGIVAKKTVENTVQVKWDVADESNVKEYQIERSVDGKSYSVIGSVPAKGSHVYSFVDVRPSPGTAYYRVKNVDNDKKSKYSGVIKLNGSGTSYGTTLRAYPTPAQEQVTIEHRKLSADAKITISTVDGRTLKTVIPASGASHTPIILSGIPKGVYIVRLEDGQNAPETSKLIKQ